MPLSYLKEPAIAKYKTMVDTFGMRALLIFFYLITPFVAQVKEDIIPLCNLQEFYFLFLSFCLEATI